MKAVVSVGRLFICFKKQLNFKQVILCFYESKYGKCLKLLEEMKDNLLLDVHLSGHVHNLYSLIRNRSLIQYFRSENCFLAKVSFMN